VFYIRPRVVLPVGLFVCLNLHLVSASSRHPGKSHCPSFFLILFCFSCFPELPSSGNTVHLLHGCWPPPIKVRFSPAVSVPTQDPVPPPTLCQKNRVFHIFRPLSFRPLLPASGEDASPPPLFQQLPDGLFPPTHLSPFWAFTLIPHSPPFLFARDLLTGQSGGQNESGALICADQPPPRKSSRNASPPTVLKYMLFKGSCLTLEEPSASHAKESLWSFFLRLFFPKPSVRLIIPFFSKRSPPFRISRPSNKTPAQQHLAFPGEGEYAQNGSCAGLGLPPTDSSTPPPPANPPDPVPMGLRPNPPIFPPNCPLGHSFDPPVIDISFPDARAPCFRPSPEFPSPLCLVFCKSFFGPMAFMRKVQVYSPCLHPAARSPQPRPAPKFFPLPTMIDLVPSTTVLPATRWCHTTPH